MTLIEATYHADNGRVVVTRLCDKSTGSIQVRWRGIPEGQGCLAFI